MTTFRKIKSFFKQSQNSAPLDWDEAYEELLPKVYNFFRYRFFDNGLAEELTAETLSRAWQSQHRYRPDLAKFSTWVLGIARHVALDELRRRNADETDFENIEISDNQIDVENSVQAHQQIDELKTHLAKLTADEQELVGLKYGAGMTNRAIAEITGLSESNVGTVLHRIVTRLRVNMEVKV